MRRVSIAAAGCALAVSFVALAPAPTPSATTPAAGSSNRKPHGTGTPAPRGTAAPKPGRTRAPKAGGTAAPKPGGTQAPKSGGAGAPKPSGTGAPKPGDTAAPKPGTTPAPAKSPTPAPSPNELPVGIAIFRNGVTPSPDPFPAFVKSIDAIGPFHAFVVDDTCTSNCPRVSDARIFVQAQLDKADDTNPNGAVTYTSYFVSPSDGIQRIGSTSVPIGDKGSIPTPAPDALKGLIGNLTFDSNYRVSISFAGNEDLLQLVPAPVNANDPDFEPILEHILEGKGIPSQRSRFTANALHGPQDTTTCPGAQRYLVYRVRLATYKHLLAARTYLDAFAEGFVLDCTQAAFVPSASGAKRMNLTQTSPFLTDLMTLLVALKPKAGTAAMTGGIAAFSNLVDIDPNDASVKERAAADALAAMVDHLCERLDFREPPEPGATPSPTPSPTTPPKGGRFTPPPAVRGPLMCRRWSKQASPSPSATAPSSTAARTARSSRGPAGDAWFDAHMTAAAASPRPR